MIGTVRPSAVQSFKNPIGLGLPSLPHRTPESTVLAAALMPISAPEHGSHVESIAHARLTSLTLVKQPSQSSASTSWQSSAHVASTSASA